MRTVVVGLDPGQAGRGPLDPAFPSGGRLASLCGLSPDDFSARFDRVNLHPAPGHRDDREAAVNLLPVLRGRRVVALGGRVSAALGLPPGPRHAWSVAPGWFVGAAAHHPSGLSRVWNDPENVLVARRFWSGLLRPCVHVEGVDGSGKSTLVAALAPLLGLRPVPTDDPPADWAECLRRVGLRLDPGIVCDRSSGLVSELVYGPVLRGGVRAPGGEGDLWALVRALAGVVTFVYCRPPDPEVLPKFRGGEDPAHVRSVRDRLPLLLARYDLVFERMTREGCRVVRYDRTRVRPEEVAACVA